MQFIIPLPPPSFIRSLIICFFTLPDIHSTSTHCCITIQASTHVVVRRPFRTLTMLLVPRTPEHSLSYFLFIKFLLRYVICMP